MFAIKKKEEFVTKSLRFAESLEARLRNLCDKEGVSFNKLVVQCCEYALNDMKK